LEADAEQWVRLGFGGFFLTSVAPDWSADVWAADGEPWTIGASDRTFQQVKRGNARCRELGAEVFLTMSFGRRFEWFNDTAWPHIGQKFRQFALFARDTGCAGVAIDIEYIHEQYHFTWPGYTYEGYNRRRLVETICARMTALARALYEEFPELVLLTLPEGTAGLGGVIQAAWIEEAARRRAPGGVHLCTEYSYRRPNLRFLFAHAWLCHRVIASMLSESGRRYWRERCSLAQGLWPLGDDPDDYHGAAPSVEEFRQAFAASLMTARRYNWVYSHDYRPFLLGRNLDKYTGPANLNDYLRVVRERRLVGDTKYVGLARELRQAVLRDYSADLGVSVVATFAGPREEGEVGLMPTAVLAPSEQAPLQPLLWDLRRRLHEGEEVDRRACLGTETEWNLIGPFDNAGGRGHATVYPPEQELNLAAEYAGLGARVRWQRHAPPPRQASVDLARVFKPAEHACAYALAWIHSPQPRAVQVRLGANDTCKLWVNNLLVFENPNDGRIILDKDVVPVSLPAGASPVLLKVGNLRLDWGFIFRLTDSQGRPLPDVKLRPAP
jgi:hypothetical protein